MRGHSGPVCLTAGSCRGRGRTSATWVRARRPAIRRPCKDGADRLPRGGEVPPRASPSSRRERPVSTPRRTWDSDDTLPWRGAMIIVLGPRGRDSRAFARVAGVPGGGCPPVCTGGRRRGLDRVAGLRVRARMVTLAAPRMGAGRTLGRMDTGHAGPCHTLVTPALPGSVPTRRRTPRPTGPPGAGPRRASGPARPSPSASRRRG